MPRVVVLVVDGLGTKYLGPYGNTWIETPAFNHLAVESLLIDGLYAPFSDGGQSLDAMWRGRSAFDQQVADLENSDLLTWLHQQRINTQLITDDGELTDQLLAANFAEQLEIEAASGVQLAAEWDDTHTASFFAQAVRAIEQLGDRSLLWLQTRGLGNPWDAPYAYREQFVDDEDPAPSGSAQVPALHLDADYDPDTLHEIQCSLGGQVVIIDQCLGVLLSVIREIADAMELLFVMVSPRGYPLGEHLRIGWKAPQLYHELLYVPGFVRYPDGRNALCRQTGLNELCDLTDLILGWFEGRASECDRKNREWSCSLGNGEVLLRTPVWQIRYPQSDTSEAPTDAELYLKPDDQNEVNDVADRCQHVVEAGWELIRKESCASKTGQTEIPSLLLEAP